MFYIKKLLLFSLIFLLSFSGIFLYSKPSYADKDIYYYDEKGANSVTIINYHSFFKKNEQPKINNINVNPELFEKHLKTLTDYGYKTVTEEDFIAFMKGKKRLPEKSILLTIDDGYESVYTNALPLLEKYNFNAVFFPIIYDMELGQRKDAPMISFDNLKKIANSKHLELGNHTYNLHWRGNNDKTGFEAMVFNKDSKGKLLISKKSKINYIVNDLKKAEDIIFKTTNIKVDSFSIPYGAYNKTSLEAINKAGYTTIYTTEGGTNKPYGNVGLIKRYGANENTKADNILNLIKRHEKKLDNNILEIKSKFNNKLIKLEYSLKSDNIKNYRSELYTISTNGDRNYIKDFSKSKNTAQLKNFKYNKKLEYSIKTIVDLKDGSRHVFWTYL